MQYLGTKVLQYLLQYAVQYCNINNNKSGSWLLFGFEVPGGHHFLVNFDVRYWLCYAFSALTLLVGKGIQPVKNLGRMVEVGTG